MYFPVGWPKLLSLPLEEENALQYVVANREKTLFAVLTSQAVYIWFCKPCVHLVSYRRSDDSVIVLGKNQVAEWKPDSTALAVTTSGGHLLFYRIDHGGSGSLYAQKHHRHRQDSVEVDNHLVPMMKICISGTVQIHGGIKSMVCFKDELMVSSGHGILMRIRWDGVVNNKMSISINTIRFSIDLQQSRQTQLDQPGIYFNQIEYCPLLGGFAVILGDGRAGFLTAPSARFEPQSVHGVWAQEMTNGSCIAANHKYRLIAYGCKNGQGIVYAVDEITGSLLVSHRLALSSTDYPDACNAAGAVTTLKWTSDGCALAMAWQNGGLALWSVFGAKLLCTLGGDYGCSQDAFRDNPLQIKSMEWGMEGYHLWITTSPKKLESSEAVKSLESTGNLLQLQFVKSALTVNPCHCNHEHLFLQGEDRLYINTGDTILKTNTQETAAGGTPVREMPPVLNSIGHTTQGPSLLIGNKQWQVIQLPLGYLSANWPIKFAAVDRAGHCVAVAGKTGLAHYALFTRRWKLFGNETQEQDMVVNGGLCWWRDFIIAACYNLNESRDEIRLYPRVSNLDNAFANITKVPYQVLLVNVFRDILIVFCVDYHVTMYHIERKDTKPNPTGVLTRIQDLSLANFVPHPSSLISLTLTSLRSETISSKMPSGSREAESLIVNVAGRLLMLQRDRSKPQHKDKDVKKAPQELPFLAPVVLASSVENMWAHVGYSKEKPHLMEALWLGCGAVGMKVWLPLFPTKEDKPHNFLAKRIMLPFKLQIYPLAVLFADAVVLGAANDVLTFDPMSPGLVASCQEGLPYCVMERTTQIYLHHILRQLLRRNLGFHALEIARSCTSLPYFSHVLELMLHEVLEAEATASEPIPDALLPRVVAFIQEFPQFLQTVVHCARKTEIALWPYLFATVGNPRDLFEECIQSGMFETAASYLIILQNLENPKVSRHHATQLLDCTLDHGKWELCKDLVRFLRAIGPNDPESSPRPSAPINSPGIFPHSASTPKAESMSAFPFSPPLATTQRSRSCSYNNSNFPPTSANDKQKTPNQQIPDRKTSVHRKDSGGSVDEFFLDTILTRHARKLLSSGKLKDLGLFAAHLEFPLIGWLRKERLRAAKVDDPVESLKKLHQDFLWPLPVFPLVSLSNLSPPKYVGRLNSQSSSGSPPPTDNDVNGVSIDDEVDSGILATSGSNHGYMPAPIPISKSRQPATTQTEDLLCDGKTEDAVLKPILPLKATAIGTDEVSLSTCTTTEMTSENSSTLGENEYGPDDSPWSSCQQLAELELLSQELVHRGPPKSEAELRHLLKMFSEATCLEWSLLLAVVLRDPVTVTSVVNTASMTECPLEMIGRMREALSFLELWADTECPGYRPFLYSLKPQAQVLTAIVNSETAVKTPSKTPPDTPTSPTPEASFTGSELSFHGSYGNRTDEENEVRTLDGNSESEISEEEIEPTDDDNSYQCRVS